MGHEGPERRSFDRLSQDLFALERRNAEYQKNTDEQLADILTAIKDSTAKAAEVIMLYENLKSTFKVLGWAERLATWLTKVAAGLGITWMIYKYAILEALNRSKQ